MMVFIFAILSTALLVGWFGRRWLAITFLTVALLSAVYLFLWEIRSPVYGFSMPWLQT